MRKLVIVTAMLLLCSCRSGLLPQIGTQDMDPISMILAGLVNVDELEADYAELGAVAGAEREAVGMQCSADGLEMTAAIRRFTATAQAKTGHFFADIERLRIAEQSPIMDLIRKQADSCAPLLMGHEKAAVLPALLRRFLMHR